MVDTKVALVQAPYLRPPPAAPPPRSSWSLQRDRSLPSPSATARRAAGARRRWTRRTLLWCCGLCWLLGRSPVWFGLSPQPNKQYKQALPGWRLCSYLAIAARGSTPMHSLAKAATEGGGVVLRTRLQELERSKSSKKFGFVGVHNGFAGLTHAGWR